MRLWILTRRITHPPEKGDRIRGEALHLAPQSCGFRLLRFTLQLQTQKYSTHAFPGTTFPGFHSFWLLPFPKFRSSHSRWAVHCCPRLRGEDSSSDDSANSGSDSDVALHFTILEGRASPAGIATLFFDPFSCFFFVDFFTSASFLFFEPSLFLTSGFFLICIFVLSPPSSFW